MADWGFLSAISGKNNWSAIRQEKAMDLQRVALQNQLLQQRNNREQEAIGDMQNYLAQVNNIHVLDPDAQKINAYNEELKKPLREGLMKYKGDARMWLDSGGRVELQKYLQALKEGEPTKRGLMNALNYSKSIADQQKGLSYRPTVWDANGVQQVGEFEQNYNDYLSGKTDRLNYRGGYEAPKGEPMKDFGDTYGQDRFVAEPVDPQAVYQYWLDKGANLPPRDRQHAALQKTKEYMENLKSGGAPYRRKADNPIDAQLKFANYQLAKKRLELYAKKVNGSLKNAADPYGLVFGGNVGVPQKMNVNTNAYNQIWGLPQGDPQAAVEVPIAFTPFSDRDVKDATAESLGLKFNTKEGGYLGKVTNGDRIRSYTNLTPALADLNDTEFIITDVVGNVHMPNPQDPTQSQNFVIMDINAPKSDLDLLGANNHHWFIPDSETAFSQGNIKYGEGRGATVRVLVPMPTDKITTQMYNSKLGNKLKPENESQYGNTLDIEFDPEIDKYLEPVNND